MLVAAIFAGWRLKDIANVIAIIHAFLKHNAMEYDEGKIFDDYWTELCKIELENVNELNPIEPKKFNNAFDFRAHMKDCK